MTSPASTVAALLAGAGLDVGAALVVVAHPDDESFGLGAVISALEDEGIEIRVVCLTHGEASTLGAATDLDLGELRARELRCAAEHLSIDDLTLCAYADGALADIDGAELDAIVDDHVGGAGLLVVFEPDGVTGHADHRAATAAARRVAARRGLPVLEWGVAPDVAAQLNAELGTGFVAFDGDDVVVDRARQRQAIDCHGSQASTNPVLARRLELQGDHERVRLHVSTTTGLANDTPPGTLHLPPGV